MQEVAAKEYVSGHISQTCSGYYREYILINGTTKNIVIVNSTGNKTIIKPDPNSQFNGVTIIIRTHNGSLSNHTGGFASYKELPTTEYRIPLEMFATQGYYFDKFGLVFVTEEWSHIAKHPQAKLNDHDTVVQAMRTAYKDLATRLVFTLNDPLKRVKHCYMHIDGVNSKINCTALPSTEHNALFSMYLSNEGEDPIRVFKLDVSDLFENGSQIINMLGITVGLGTTADNVIEAMDTHTNILNDEDAAKFERRSKQIKQALEEEVQSTTKSLKAELGKLKHTNDGKDNEINRLKNKLKDMEDELDAYKKIIQEFKIASDYHTHHENNHQKMNEQEHKSKEQEFRKWKAAGSILDIVLKTLGVVLTTYLAIEKLQAKKN